MTDLTKRRGPCRALAPLVLAFVVGASCSQEASATPPRLVVLYSTCTLSTDFLSPYAPDVRYTPNLQRFADGGVVFRRHVSEAGQSGVAFASIYTGTQADRHGIFHHPMVLPDDLYLVSEAFADGGYASYFWSGHPMAAGELGYGQGIPPEHVYHRHAMFTKEAKHLREDFLVGVTANGPELERVLAELAADPSLRAYLQINFTITHELYHEYVDADRIATFRERFPEAAGPWSRAEVAETLAFFEEHRHALQLNHPATVAQLGLGPEEIARIDGVLRLTYAACVQQLDEYFGVFLDKIERAGLMDESLIVLTADHGETFYRENEPFHWMHGLQLAPTVLRVPMIVRALGLGLEAGGYEEVTRSIDVFPTLAGLCGLSFPRDAGVAGTDLAPALRGDEPAPRLFAYSHTSTLGPGRVGRYRREGRDLVCAYLPEAEARHMWVGLRDRDLVFKLRPLEPGRWGAVAYDLASDPGEKRNIFDPSRDEHAEMAEKLRVYKQLLIRAFEREKASGRGRAPTDALQRLRALGYVGDDPGDG